MALTIALLTAGVVAVAPQAEAQTETTGRAAGADRLPVTEVGATNWTQVSAGGSHTCGLRASGRLFCWGSDANGQLGDGGTNTNQPAPVQVAGGATNWATVEAGNDHTCALKTTGRLFCWGADFGGQLGDGAPIQDQDQPVQVAGGATDWTALSAGGDHNCARKTGRLFCWGQDFFGQIGDGGANLDQLEPVRIGSATNWVGVDPGYRHTCARRATGRIYCWGSDSNGQLGNGGPNTERSAPVQIAGGATNWASIDSGSYHSCARKNSGRLYCWGDDREGELGDGPPNTEHAAPVQVAGGATNWTAVSGGYAHTCARRATGRIYCWGDDESGQLGDSVANTDHDEPVQVAGGATNWTAVDGGWDQSCARKANGRLYCWGDDFYGQLGNGAPNADRARPVQVA